MSASIYWCQVRPVSGERLSAWAPSSFISSIEKAFGGFPCDFGNGDIEKLKGMASMCNDGGGNPYQEIINRIEKYGVIRVWAEY